MCQQTKKGIYTLLSENEAVRKKWRKGYALLELSPRVFYSYFLGIEGGVENNGKKGQEKEVMKTPGIKEYERIWRWHILESSRKGGWKLPK